MNGGFYPLKEFSSEADYNRVVDDMLMSDGTLWPMPINPDVSEDLVVNLNFAKTSPCAIWKV